MAFYVVFGLLCYVWLYLRPHHHFAAFWGAAIVIFLAKIINLHNHDLQNFWIEISSQVTNGEPLPHAHLSLQLVLMCSITRFVHGYWDW